MQFLLVLNI